VIYMDAATARNILARLANALSDGGWLVVSSVEAALVQLPDMETVSFPSATLFRKTSRAVGRKLTPIDSHEMPRRAPDIARGVSQTISATSQPGARSRAVGRERTDPIRLSNKTQPASFVRASSSRAKPAAVTSDSSTRIDLFAQAQQHANLSTVGAGAFVL
jgi:hypothetical protein